jgi:CelD/BcsL family acetyltransferase involved in cellulose biosynthesis
VYVNSKGSVIRRFTRPATLATDLPRWGWSGSGANPETPMQSRAWIVACAETFVADGALEVVVLEDSDGVAAVAPLVTRPQFPARRELIGVRELSEPSDLAFRDADALAALLRSLARSFMPLILQRVPARSPTVATLGRAFRGRGVVLNRPDNTCPHLDLPPGQSLDSVLPARLRSDLRRAQRKAEAIGTVSFEMHAPRTREAFEPLFEQLLRVEAAGWKGRSGSAVAVNEGPRAFFDRFGTLAAEDGMLRIAFLRIGGVPAAMQYAVQWDGAFWLLKVGYDEQFSRCSPGMLLMQHTVQYALGERLRSYEFLGSAEPWTQRWTTSEAPTSRIMVYPFGASGVFSLTRDVVRAVGRKVGARVDARRRPRTAPLEVTAAAAGADGD